MKNNAKIIYHNKRKQQPLFVFGHRGAPKIYPENSLQAINEAIKKEVDGVEFDIRLTKDREVILFHDDYIACGEKKYFISKTPYKTIKKICTKNQVPPPDLFLNMAPIINQNPTKLFNIEIKSTAYNNAYILRYILNNICNSALKNQCIISSFNILLLYQLKIQFNYKYSLGYILASKSLKHWWGLLYNKICIYFLRPHFFHMNIDYINRHIISWIHSKNILINTYTVNNMQTIKKCIKLNVDGVFTDDHHLYKL